MAHLNLASWVKNFLVFNRPQGYLFGLEIWAGDICELHGPFDNAGQAMGYGTRLMNGFADYTSAKVVKIELPGVNGYVFDRKVGWTGGSNE
jgi:hypothetical protein